METSVFDKIYASDAWNGGSGPGSFIENSFAYVGFLTYFLKKNKIKKVLDIGCGDWQAMRYVDLATIDYVGVDVVDKVIEGLSKEFSSPNIEFLVGDATNIDFFDQELVLCKDVFMHLPNKYINDICDKVLTNCKYFITTNDVLQQELENMDCEIGGYRAIDLSKQPFCYESEFKYFYNSDNGKIKSIELLKLKRS